MGPLSGIKIIEIAGLGPGPFAGMIFADMGADVVLIERKTDDPHKQIPDCHKRGKRSVAMDLKDPEGVATLLRLVEKTDVLIEGFRPGVMERLGLGPEVCLTINPKLVYGRMTGWGQTGPLANAAGHDINYIALTGALHAIGSADENPVPPLNLVGDYGGGGMFLVVGVLAALLEVQKSGKGQVVDAAMTDGSAVLMSIINTLDAIGMWSTKRASNLLDSGSHYYNTYKTLDGKYIAIGSIEPKFYALLIEKANLDPNDFADQQNPVKWSEMKSKLQGVFMTRTREHWCEIMEGTDVCFAPVLDYKEAQNHPHNVQRKTYINIDGITQPAPAPRFSRTISEVISGAPAAGQHTKEVFRDWGVDDLSL